MTEARPKLRCRPILEEDLETVVALLRRGFPKRPEAYWRQGFEILKERPVPARAARFGFLMESAGRPVGVILLLSAEPEGRARVNLSSWYVEPEFRSFASLLVFAATKRRDVTYLNVSPAPNTWATIEAQGFRRYTSGQFFSIPLLGRSERHARVRRFDPARAEAEREAPAEYAILLDHARFGWMSLVVEASDGLHPFVFTPFRIRSGRVRLPIAQLVYCRSVDEFVRFAAPLGRWLLLRGFAFVVHDANGPEPGLAGRFRDRMGPKYALGPHPPRRGDLAYTERVIFGP